jgi:hypothetical protein
LREQTSGWSTLVIRSNELRYMNEAQLRCGPAISAGTHQHQFADWCIRIGEQA